MAVATLAEFHQWITSTMRQILKERLRAHGVLAVEMEASALYSIAARKGRRALSILTVSDHVFTHESMDSDARERSLNNMVEIGLVALNA
jgi:purine-nucleoside phosphorylase